MLPKLVTSRCPKSSPALQSVRAKRNSPTRKRDQHLLQDGRRSLGVLLVSCWLHTTHNLNAIGKKRTGYNLPCKSKLWAGKGNNSNKANTSESHARSWVVKYFVLRGLEDLLWAWRFTPILLTVAIARHFRSHVPRKSTLGCLSRHTAHCALLQHQRDQLVAHLWPAGHETPHRRPQIDFSTVLKELNDFLPTQGPS